MEGGAITLRSLIASGCVDEYVEYRNTSLRVGGGIPSPEFPNDWQQQANLGKDLLRIFKVPIGQPFG